ncbi:hypothetical protein B7R21_04855 [Subtercola boreus]|uniref:YncI copper-binding domain-containing protein n=1 Tax=Subtercola boreus TaxID=120213 RepID=A0A3E0W188_9MICO|nr:YcnI family protein [Subtercola boreus]RFA15348.1 hypothetical protein B7R21_04855 [Subtercola boreus]
MQKRTLIRYTTALTAAGLLALAAPLSASAHVRVTPDQAVAGSYSTLTFKVPTESATASTTKLEVDLPTDTPFGSVSYQPLPGWSVEVITSTLPTPVVTDDGTVTEAPTKIVWTADAGSAVAPGAFQLFSISAGPVPDTGSIALPAHQTYSDGSVVDWTEATPASGVEPELPAPTLYINDAPPAEAGAAGATVSATSAPTADTASGSTVAIATGVGIGGLALGAIALVVAVVALTRKRPAGR